MHRVKVKLFGRGVGSKKNSPPCINCHIPPDVNPSSDLNMDHLLLHSNQTTESEYSNLWQYLPCMSQHRTVNYQHYSVLGLISLPQQCHKIPLLKKYQKYIRILPISILTFAGNSSRPVLLVWLLILKFDLDPLTFTLRRQDQTKLRVNAEILTTRTGTGMKSLREWPKLWNQIIGEIRFENILTTLHSSKLWVDCCLRTSYPEGFNFTAEVAWIDFQIPDIMEQHNIIWFQH